MLNVFTASAGSGKTHSLTQEYIKLLMKSDDAYKHILAVTFTNKATDEMKSRVIETLFELSKQQTAEGYRAKRVLTCILHDYSAFSVSTIDRFFQTAMRAFAREIGQYSSYSVELDSEAVLSQAVDMMISSIDENHDTLLLEWLTKYSISLIESGKSWDISNELRSMGTLFMREDFKIKKRDFNQLFGDKEAIEHYREKMTAIVSEFKDSLREIGRRGCEIMDHFSLISEDFKGSSNSPFKHFTIWQRGIVKAPTVTFRNLCNDSERWSNKSSEKIYAISEAYSAGLNVAVCDAVALFDRQFAQYSAAQLIKNNLYFIGIFADMHTALERYLKDNNVVLLGETNDVLNRIIDGSDTPFVYEKIGSRYDNIMLDEFQDTSTLQWENFKPLVADNLASNRDDLIVGDVKQSIYRWRGSDWDLLDSELFKTFDSKLVNRVNLEYNWRSCENIVEFNNKLYSEMADILGSLPAISEKVRSIYSGCSQLIPEKTKGKMGHVKVSFVDAGQYEGDGGDDMPDWKYATLDRLPEAIEAVTSKGYAKSDITILVRKNAEGSAVALKLMSCGCEVITEEALSLGASPLLCKTVAVLKCLIDPNDAVNNVIIKELSIEDLEVVSSSLYDTCENIIRVVAPKVQEYEIAFVQAFMDGVMNYCSKYGSNMRGFVKWWDDTGCKSSISAPNGQNAVRIMTIHKAKGLGFKVVIIPFFEEKFEKSGSFIWCKPKEKPFDEIGLIPLQISSSLADTIFRDDYEREKIYGYIDNINTAYVATTRAEEEMIILARKPNVKKTGELPLTSVSDALYRCFDMKDEVEFGDFGDRAGRNDTSSDKPQPIEELQDQFVSIAIGDRLKLSLRGNDYFSEAEGESQRVRGIVLHDILSKIDTAQELDMAVKQAVADGDISYERAGEICDYLRRLLDSVSDRHWFDGTYRCINELAIVNTDGSVYRPDRVLVEKNRHGAGGKAVVIDYKFGMRHPSHQRQIDTYMNLLREMGYDDVSGEVWYAAE